MSSQEFSQKFSLPTCHTCPLLKTLHFYRATGKYIDVFLSVGMSQFKAHRIVLSISSPVLEKRLSALSSSMDNGPLNIALNKNLVSFSIMEDLLTFFYTSSIVLTSTNVYYIFRAADHLEIESLLLWCSEFFLTQLRPDNAVLCFLTSNEFKIDQFVSQSREYLLTYISDSMELNFDQMRTRIELLFVRMDHKRKSVQWAEKVAELTIDLARHFSDYPTIFCLLLRNLPLDKLPSLFFKGLLLQEVLPHPVSTFLTSFLLPKIDYNGLYCITNYDGNFAVSHLSSTEGAWKPVHQRVSSRTSFDSVVTRRHIYTVWNNDNGDNGTFEMYDCLTKRVTEMTPMPHNCAFSAVTAYNGYIYVSGGANHEPLSSMTRYNIVTNEWESCARMLSPRLFHQLVELRGRLYAIGGVNKIPESQDNLLNNSRIFKISLKRSSSLMTFWKQSKQLLKSSKDFVSESSIKAISTVEVYDPENDHWKLAADTNYGYCMFGATVHAGKIYVCSHEAFEVYSPEVDTWKILPSPPSGYSVRSLVSFEGKLLAIGGDDTLDSAVSSVIFYDFETLQWTRLPDIDVKRGNHSLFVVDF